MANFIIEMFVIGALCATSNHLLPHRLKHNLMTVKELLT